MKEDLTAEEYVQALNKEKRLLFFKQYFDTAYKLAWRNLHEG
jgi:hypothetical protein